MLRNWGRFSLPFVALRVLNSATTFGEVVETRYRQCKKGNVLTASH